MTTSDDVLHSWLDEPGRPLGIGALLDEYARAAEDICVHVEALGADAIGAPWSQPGEFAAPLDVLRHVLRAAWGYAGYLRGAAGLPAIDPPADRDALAGPADLRPKLRAALDATVTACAPMAGDSEEQLGARKFVVSWGDTYDPDSLLEHAVMHLYRHRRQIVRGTARH